MPPSSAPMARSISTGSPARSKRAALTRSASRPVSSGELPGRGPLAGTAAVLMWRSSRISVRGAMEHRVAQPGVVLLAGRRQDHRLGQFRANEALAFERGPDRRVAQPGRVACGDDRLAEMEMIA